MKIAYIAGPYRGKSKNKIINWLQRQANIRRAAKVAKWAWKQGYAVICPHLNSKNFDGIIPDKRILEGDLKILKRCDVMILVPGWKKSTGTRYEIIKAVKHYGISSIFEYHPTMPRCAENIVWLKLAEMQELRANS